MDTWSYLFRDPLFLAALIVFMVTLAVFMWFSLALVLAFPRKNANKQGQTKKPTEAGKSAMSALVPKAPPPAAPAPAPPQASASGPQSNAPAGLGEKDTAELNKFFEARFLELTKRIANLEIAEHKHATKGLQPSFLEPLIKRVQDLETELNKIKVLVSQLSSVNKADLTTVKEKVNGLQKMMEHLSGGSEVAKPS